jgi:oxygen-independent coproporphyrinogen III oxidase
MTALNSLYFHIPFCIHRCAYCDFNTYAGRGADIPDYVEAICREVETIGHSAGERLPVGTIFFGGGTPSLMKTRQFEKILRAVDGAFDLVAPEISLEANPGTVTGDQLKSLHGMGFNRLSLGMQSSHPEELRQLERIHDFYDVIRAVTWARQAGYNNLNLDLIFGLPEQTLEHWQASLRRAVDLHPEHLSLYALTIEPGTPFGRWADHGILAIPDPDAAAEMYESASTILEQNSYKQYEISNWAINDAGLSRACRHNLQTWRNQPYLGFGAGAHGYSRGVRYSNILHIGAYIKRMAGSSSVPFPLSPAAVHHHRIGRFEAMQETMMLGLRLTDEGVAADEFARRFGVELQTVFGKEIRDLVHAGLLEWVEKAPALGEGPLQQVLRLTRPGRLLGNRVFMKFVS